MAYIIVNISRLPMQVLTYNNGQILKFASIQHAASQTLIANTLTGDMHAAIEEQKGHMREVDLGFHHVIAPWLLPQLTNWSSGMR